MKNIKSKIISLFVITVMLAGGLVASANKQQSVLTEVKTQSAPAAKTVDLDLKSKSSSSPIVNEKNYSSAQPLDIVANPCVYVGKQVKFRAVFDKFSTLGLDYKPAFRDSQKYISFLIKRDDVTDHTIPLSEMKIFIKRTEAEKFIDLESGDIIEVYGKVFSAALNDAWVDTDKLVVLTKKNKKEDKKA